MADAEDKDKAEKLAAAKKRFEQLKKQQTKKGKKAGGSKKKDDDTTAAEEKADDTVPEAAEEGGPESVEVTEDQPPAAEAAPTEEPPAEKEGRPLTRQSSLSKQSKARSESFRRGSISAGLKSPTLAPFSPEEGVQDIYTKQKARIEELEKEAKAGTDAQAKLATVEEELEGYRESNANTAELRSKAALAEEKSRELEKVQVELGAMQRQLTHAQQSAKNTQRRVSGQSPEITEQLASKTATIESLELEISNLRNQLNTVQSVISSNGVTAKELEEKVQAAETTAENAKQELDTLRTTLEAPKETSKDASSDPEALTKRNTLLESDLRTANSAANTSAQRAKVLEQKIEALTKLHRDFTTANAARENELKDLRTQVKILGTKANRASHFRDANSFELEEDEGVLQSKIRELEAENFDLRRGVWREKRAEIQPGMEETTAEGSYEDIDLNGSGSPYSSRMAQRGSSFQDVISSGISAFTGRPREPPGPRGATAHAGHAQRKLSLGMTSEDGFDEEAFAMAQEEEAKRRVERVKEVKRGLEQWRGWRIDLVDSRRGGLGGGRECGPVFEV